MSFCDAYAENLRVGRKYPGWCARLMVLPEFEELPWRDVDPYEEFELFWSMVDYREEVYRSNHWAHSKESMREGRNRVEDRIASRTITFQDARIDLDGDGVAERILKFRDGGCISKLYWVDLYVVSNEGPWIDRPRTKAYFHRDSDEAARVPFYAKPEGRYDAFLYRGKFYFDIWDWDEVSEGGYPSDDRSWLDVYEIFEGRRRPVCQLMYKDPRMWRKDTD